MSAYVGAITQRAARGRYAQPVPTQHAAEPGTPKIGGLYRAICGAAVQHVGSVPFDPDHAKACRRCRELAQ